MYVVGAPVLARADLTAGIDAIVSSQKDVQLSIHVVDANTCQTLYDHNSRELMIPASNMKIVTTAAAIKYLGADFQYKTTVGLSDGALVVIGSGDPLLGDVLTDKKYGRQQGWIFRDITSAIKSQGLRAITDIIVDTGVFDDERTHSHWPTDQLNRGYAAEVCGLNYRGNCIDITVENISGKLAVTVDPPTRFVSITNEVTPVSGGDGAVGAYRNRVANRLVLRGKCRTKELLSDIAIERPAAFFGFLLAENLAKEGIKTDGQLIEKALDKGAKLKLLAEYTTSLGDCLARCNKDSFGLAAEALLKTIAANARADKRGGSWAQGRAMISAYLSGLGLDDSQFYIDDGSGLSRENELSAYAITTVLLALYKSEDWQLFRDSLAVGGADGTIGRYFDEEPYKGRILGKTGYLRGVRAFSGVCETASGDYLFSILANNADGIARSAINDIAKAIMDHGVKDVEQPEPELSD
jgi:D-alanyl-D-alanine carboxypeptidase/D-alanyl-D-alanine-endopeptidase (penicillin-binding protein 4)